MNPVRTTVEGPIGAGAQQVWIVRGVDLNQIQTVAAIPTAGYAVGSMQLHIATGSAGSLVLTAQVSNDPHQSVFASHPSSITLSAAGVTAGFPLEHQWLVPAVTTAAGSAATGDLYIYLKA
jgi:hypothetical protein